MKCKRLLCVWLSLLMLLSLVPSAVFAEEPGDDGQEPAESQALLGEVAVADTAETDDADTAEAIRSGKEALKNGADAVLIGAAVREDAASAADDAREEAPAAEDADAVVLTLGNSSEMMLLGGGRMVQAGEILYFLDSEDDTICRYDGETTERVWDAPARCLNYINDKLYFATEGDGGFRVLALDPATLETAELSGLLDGTLRQMYVTSDGTVWYAADDRVCTLPPGGEPETVRTADALFSFVPTGAGVLYACGSLFDLTLYLDGREIDRSVEDYYVLNDETGARLVYSKDGADLQIALSTLLTTRKAALRDEAAAFTGLVKETAETAADADRAGSVLGKAALLPDEDPDAAAEVKEIELAHSQTRGSQPKTETLSRPITLGMANTARRGYQMTDIKWTPVQTVSGWTNNGGSGTKMWYYAGTTYTGLPYGWPYDVAGYVPWDKSINQFIEAVGNSGSRFYTVKSGVRNGLSYATDCSGFVSWAWQAQGGRQTCTSLMAKSYCMLVSRDSYATAEIGDALISSSHTVLITDIRYNSSGTITAIEVAEATVNLSNSFCAYRHTYGEGGSASLATLQSYYLNGGYNLYRNLNRETVVFTENVYVPVSHPSPIINGSNAEEIHKGIDVSVWNGDIDWKTVAQNVDFAIIRCAYGTTPDSKFETNVKGCEANNIPYGVYVYARATSEEDALAEANTVLMSLLMNGHIPKLPVFYDVEDNATIFQCSNDQILDIVTAFCTVVEDTGLRAGVYCSTSFWNSKLNKSEYSKWCRWVAQYYRTCEYSGGMNLWQYSGSGRVPGISTDVDLNYWFGKVGDESHMYIMDEKDPTCAEPGWYSFAATDGKVHWTVEIPALEHSFQAVVTAPTCMAGGYTTYTCSACGYSYVADATGKVDHYYRNGKCYYCGKEDPNPNYEIRFDDVADGMWYHDAVEFVVRRKLFNGTSLTIFSPQKSMTRGMLVTVLWRLAGTPATVGDNPFKDVGAGLYYTDAVVWAYENGIVNGVSSDRFAPSREVTRQQAATMLRRYAAWKGLPTDASAPLDAYPDEADVAGFAVEAMAWAVGAGLIGGVRENDGKDYLRPNNYATRAQVAVILKRFVENVVEK